MKNEIEFETGVYGARAIIGSAWKDSYLELLRKKEIKELELNTGKGWRSGSVEFLQYLPNLESLIIIDQTIKSIEEIHFLTNLKSINISTYCKTAIDFKKFPQLVSCGLEWRKGSESLFDCRSLRFLGINSCDLKDSSVFFDLTRLEKLTIMNSKFDGLEGLSDLLSLNYLSIANLKNVLSLKGIEELRDLEILEIQSCKNLLSVSQVFNLIKLKKFFLLDCGDIATIRGIEKLANLKEFLFYESTNIVDGDLSPVLELKNLSKIVYKNRRHYSHKMEDFGNIYTQNSN